MKKSIFITLLLFFISTNTYSQFDQWFNNKTLRIDYFHTGNSTTEIYSIHQLKTEPNWGGSLNNLIDKSEFGFFKFEVYDLLSNTLIYSRGYCTLFDEWRYTEEAKKTTRSFAETIIMPFPKKDVMVAFYSRNNYGIFERKFEYTVKVADYFITPERTLEYPIYQAHISGSPNTSVDVVILPEGYTETEMNKFKADVDKFASALFKYKPYSEYSNKFNISAVLAPSAQSGTDIPADNIWRKTLLNTSFYTFDSERYLMTYDNFTIRDLAANVPYDQIYILVNTTKYGGGAIFNFYSTSVNSNSFSDKIFVHEFGHAFAGLADEYDDGSTSYNDMYSLISEPWEPNITTLIDFDKKWKTMLPAKTSIPSDLKKAKPMELGVYEGAGYVSKGIYRPTPDCLMRSFNVNEFCPVCTKAIQTMIEFYIK